jgi:hypothetical protein
LSQAEAESQLSAAGIDWYSDTGCNDPNAGLACTSYEGINQDTVSAAIALKDACGGCEILITGGTESGHASGTYSHANGYKLDLKLVPALESYIRSAFTQTGDRFDRYAQWEAPSGNVYCVSASRVLGMCGD